ncbi:MAG: hypothetical protein M3R40_05235 [Pseudomonadota bacterium]|nr:hypothetical protein [Pseudomonadota bacterium]
MPNIDNGYDDDPKRRFDQSDNGSYPVMVRCSMRAQRLERPPRGQEKRMRTHGISSPSAAQLYFNDSIAGHVCLLLAEALGNAGRAPDAARVNSHATVVKPVAKPVEAPRMSVVGPPQDANCSPQGDSAAAVLADAAASAGGRMSWLDRLDAWFQRQEQKDREAYLARSRDVFELERRIELLNRNGIARYY